MSDNHYFHPETLKRISRLDLRAKHVVDGFLSGIHKSRHFGNSVEFRQHRQYVPGDDPRSVDWKVWAKQDRLYVKQYEVDTNMRVTLLVDRSQSMRFGSKAMNKYDYASTTAASLAYLAIRQQDAVGCIMFDKDTQNVMPSKMKRSQLIAIADRMFRLSPDKKTEIQKTELRNTETKKKESSELIDLNELLKDIKGSQPDFQEALRTAAETVRANGLIVLISDLLIQREGLFRGLQYLRSYGHDVLVLHIMDDMELDFTLGGATRFEGLELPVQIRCDPRMLRQGYLDALHLYLDEVKQGCTKLQCDYALFRTGTPLDAALATYLSRRNMIVRNKK
ncbi:MAG: DUF58 domain-containing protein [Planctomycetaceae bacterium]|jgi:uncharacterized protein (DUF58 family)|nr:DUF58 domain-containing protein [Planctomycetaceae bacterium]